MKESAFSYQLRKDLEGLYADRSHKPHINLIQDAYRSGKKPYDFYFVQHDSFYAIETKVCRGLSINFEMVRQHQITGLFEVENSGPAGKAYLVILLEKYDKRKAMVMPIFNWIAMLKMYALEHTSLKIETLFQVHRDWFQIMERKKIDGKTRWDIVNGIIKYPNRY